jgi:hypothetical protein
MAVVKSKRVWLVQFLLNPVLIALGTLWLLIPEAHTWQVVTTTVLGLVVVLFFLWLQSATLVYFDEFHTKGTARLRDALRPANTVAFAIWAAILATVLYYVDDLSDLAPQLTIYLRSISPLWFRRSVTEVGMDRFMTLTTWVLFWIVVPGLLLPLGLQVGKYGYRALHNEGLLGWRKAIGSRVYWSVLIVLVVVGVYLPERLIAWLPEASSVSGETTSLVLRFLLAWLLTASSWTLLASVLGRVSASEPGSDVRREPAN